MGYTISIGNATPWHEKDEDSLRAGWRVARVKHDAAPAFGDPTDHQNQRWPSYTAWNDSMRALGLHDLFFKDYEGLMAQHPGCAPITAGHAAIVKAAVLRRRETNGGKPAGFHDMDLKTFQTTDNGNDPDLARGVWLEYWMEWAVANCETPAIQNS